MTQERSLEIIGKAELIFEGTIVSFEERAQPEENADYGFNVPVPQSPLYSRARLKITEPYKGGMAGDRVDAYIDTMSECGYAVEQGDEMTFLLTSRDDVLVQSSICDDPLPAHWTDLKAGKFRD